MIVASQAERLEADKALSNFFATAKAKLRFFTLQKLC